MVNQMSAYTAIVTRESGKWLASVKDMPGGHTFASSLEGLRRSLREVVVLLADLGDEAQPDIRLEFDLDDPVLTDALDVAERRKRLLAEEGDVRAATARAAQALTDAGYSTRDVARLIGVTPGRVSQMIPRRLVDA